MGVVLSYRCMGDTQLTRLNFAFTAYLSIEDVLAFNSCLHNGVSGSVPELAFSCCAYIPHDCFLPMYFCVLFAPCVFR